MRNMMDLDQLMRLLDIDRSRGKSLPVVLRTTKRRRPKARTHVPELRMFSAGR